MAVFDRTLPLKIVAFFLQIVAYPFWIYLKFFFENETIDPDRIVAPQSPRTVVITGASQGIGEGLVEYYYRSCSSCQTIVLISRSREKLENVQKRLKDPSSSKEMVLYPCDVTNAEQMKEILLKIYQIYGKIDILYANAGVSFRQLKEAQPLSQAIRDTFEINMNGVINTVIPLIEVKGVHQIALISSQAGYAPVFSAIYGTSKQFVTSFGRDLRKMLAKDGVAVNIVSPGPVKTPMLVGSYPNSVKRCVTTDQAAQIIVRGLRRNEAEIVFPAHTGIFIYLIRLLPWSIAEKIVCYFMSGR